MSMLESDHLVHSSKQKKINNNNNNELKQNLLIVHTNIVKNCGWCGKNEIGERNFCSDACFVQCQRAAFKRAKVCDW